MPPTNPQHRRTHNLLLISKLLNQKESASPFTLIVDCLEQSGKPLLREYIRRASAAKNKIIYVSFETLKKPRGVDVFIPAWSEDFAVVQKSIVAQLAASPPTQRKTIIFDTLNPLCSSPTTTNLPSALSSLISPSVSLISLYHADIPVAISVQQTSPYAPAPLTILRYLATTILTTHSLHHVLARKAARERSVAEPVFGLEEEIEGVLVGLRGGGSSDGVGEGLVLEMEYRRKSGRGVREWYFLPSSSPSSTGAVKSGTGGISRFRESVMLLEDHPLFKRAAAGGEDDGAGEGKEGLDVTFELGLTDRQRKDREEVVLPYFDAQKVGGGEGGRILYDMGVEDDFDEEEDEI